MAQTGLKTASHQVIIMMFKASFSFESLIETSSEKHAMTSILWDGIISGVRVKLTRPATSLTPMAPTKDMSPLIFWKPSSKNSSTLNLTGKHRVNLHFDMSCRAPLYHAETGGLTASRLTHFITYITTGFGWALQQGILAGHVCTLIGAKLWYTHTD